MGDPYAALGDPVHDADPYAALGSPVEGTAPAMQTFSTQRNGKTVSFQAPESATDAELRQAAAKATGSNLYLRSKVRRQGIVASAPEDATTTFVKHGADSYTAGLIAPFGAALDAIIPGVAKLDGPDYHSMWDSGKGFTETWRDNMASWRGQQDADRAEHPVAAISGTIGGAILSPVNKIAAPIRGASIATNAARAGVQGATYGAIHGAADNVGNGAGAIARGAATESAFGYAGGALLGTALPALIRGGAAVGGAIRRTLTGTPSTTAADIIASRLAADNITPADAATAMSKARANGTPTVLADLGENVRALGGSVSRQPGAARTTAMATTGERQLGQGERVRDAINRDLGPTTDTFAEANRLHAQARADSAPLYRAFHANAPRTSQEIDGLLQTPAGRAALGRARTIAANDQVPAAQLGTEIDAAGNPVLNGQPVDALAEHDAARAALDEAQAAYGEARNTPGSPSMDAARGRVLAARERLRDAATAVSGAPDPALPAQMRVYTPQTLDYVKQGIDDVLNDYRNGVTGKLDLGPYGGSIEGVRRRFVGEMDRLYPDYAPARAAYAGPASLKSALADGRSALNKSAEEINQRLVNMTAPEQAHYALGLRSAIAENVSAAPDGANAVRRIVGSDKKRQALARVFGGSADLDRFLETLGNEDAAARTYTTIHGGSPTASRVGEDAANADLGVAQQALELAKTLRRPTATGIVNHTAGLGIARLQDAFRYGAGQAGERARENAASLLFSSNPSEFGDALDQSYVHRLVSINRLKAAETSGAKVGGRVGALIGAGQR